MWLPNIRSNFVPDPGYMVFDIDLDRADAQVVAWDAGAENLKRAFRQGIDLHLLNANLVFNLGWSEEQLIEGTESHRRIKAENKKVRDKVKAAGHATNYLVQPKTLAQTLGSSMQEAENFQEAYFKANPEILEWHNEIDFNLQSTMTITNVFGYSITYFDRPKNVLTDAVAWIPQSTVGIVTNHMWDNLVTNLADWDVQVWFQVHDSLVGQFPIAYYPRILPYIHEQTLVTMPYEDPRQIPTGIKVSRRSWGEAKDVDWNEEAA